MLSCLLQPLLLRVRSGGVPLHIRQTEVAQAVIHLQLGYGAMATAQVNAQGFDKPDKYAVDRCTDCADGFFERCDCSNATLQVLLNLSQDVDNTFRRCPCPYRGFRQTKVSRVDIDNPCLHLFGTLGKPAKLFNELPRTDQCIATNIAQQRGRDSHRLPRHFVCSRRPGK
ncbi:hypothetical protein D3C85_1309050 [compost metagenome]